MRQYLDAVREVLTRGTRKKNRTGVDTLSAFNINYAIDLAKGFPLLTTKEISWKNIVVENLWFLSGEPHIEMLRRHGCKFWDPWADKAGLVPSAYGHFWRHFPVARQPSKVGGDPPEAGMGPTGNQGPATATTALVEEGTAGSLGGGDRSPGGTVVVGAAQGTSGGGPEPGEPGFNDQVRWVLDELDRNPDSRRLIISAWYPDNAQTSALPPCHLLFIFNVQYTADGEPRLNLHLTQRSCDIALGVPYNIAGYSFLLELFARLSNIRAGLFAHTLVDAHIYTAKADGSMAGYDHGPGLKLQLARELRPLPRLEIDPELHPLDDVMALTGPDIDTATLLETFKIVGYNPHPPINFKVAV